MGVRVDLLAHLAAGAEAAGAAPPIGLAVTVFTSDAGAPAHIVPSRLRMALEAGCGGIVCAAEDLEDARTLDVIELVAMAVEA